MSLSRYLRHPLSPRFLPCGCLVRSSALLLIQTQLHVMMCSVPYAWRIMCGAKIRIIPIRWYWILIFHPLWRNELYHDYFIYVFFNVAGKYRMMEGGMQTSIELFICLRSQGRPQTLPRSWPLRSLKRRPPCRAGRGGFWRSCWLSSRTKEVQHPLLQGW